MSSTQGPDSILVLGTGVFGLTLLWELMKRYPKTQFIVVSPSIPENLASADASSSHTADAAAPRIASNDVNRIIRPDYADSDYAELMRLTMPRWRETPGLSAHYHQSGLLLTADKDTVAEKYVGKSLANVKAQGRHIEEYRDEASVREAMRSPVARATGSSGYLNKQSGWADAGGALDWVWEQVAAASKSREIRFVRKPVERLVTSEDARKIHGAVIEGGEEVKADLTILATGAWTPALLDMRGIASARGQCIGYVDVTGDEARALQNVPVHFNMSRGCFFFPPNRKESGGWELKVARHAFGYSNPSTSVPSFPDRLPDVDKARLLEFLRTCLSSVDLAGRHFRSRFCWYLDTASSDFIGCYHPNYGHSLFVATGGSGHGYKFLPTLGEYLADILDESDRAKTGGKWISKWRWPAAQRDPEIWCFDGSRAGKPGITLDEALAGSGEESTMTRARL